MRHILSMKFILCYVFIGIFSFFMVTLGGSYLIEKYYERDLSEALYTEANNIASYDVVKNNLSKENAGQLRKSLTTLSMFQNSVIWIINNKGEIILSTRKDIDFNHPIPIQDFDAATWGDNYYQIGKFYDYFKDDQISVIAPVTADMTIKGYVALHYSMETLYQTRGSLVLIMQGIFLIMYALTYLLLLVYRYHIYLPLQVIIKGATEYAGGNLAYKIPLKSDDELGYLANTLNYMSDELNKNGEYQRKFVSDISHDFRSPLTSIKGYVEAILDGTIPPEMQEKYLRIIASESERLEKLTRSLLTLNELDIKKRMMHIRSFDINETIKNTATFFEGVCIRRKILLELILSGKDLFVMADMEQIQQVLYNLLDNAIKFSPDNSSIIMETTEKNGKVFVSVKDHGSGIPRESLSRVWERFYKTDSSRGKDRKGTGLGLAIVKEVINAHQQHIDVISTVGVGTEFIFTLEKAK